MLHFLFAILIFPLTNKRDKNCFEKTIFQKIQSLLESIRMKFPLGQHARVRPHQADMFDHKTKFPKQSGDRFTVTDASRST